MSELIKISKEFKGAMGGVWLGKEVEIPDGADDIAEYIKQNERLEKAWMAMNPHINWLPDSTTNGSSQKVNSKDEKIQSFIATINMCTSLKFLRNFEQRVLSENNDDLSYAYSQKEKELQTLQP